MAGDDMEVNYAEWTGELIKSMQQTPGGKQERPKKKVNELIEILQLQDSMNHGTPLTARTQATSNCYFETPTPQIDNISTHRNRTKNRKALIKKEKPGPQNFTDHSERLIKRSKSREKVDGSKTVRRHSSHNRATSQNKQIRAK